MEQFFFYTAVALYAVSTVLFLGYLITRREPLARVARSVLIGSVALHLVALLTRTVIARQMPNHEWYVPWSNWFESFSFFALVIAIEFLLIQWKREVLVLGAFITPLIFGILVVALQSPVGMEIPMLPPALQSHWMAVHVPVMFAAYAGFANAFTVGLAFLLEERRLKAKSLSQYVFRLPSVEELDDLIYRVILCSFPVLTLGLFFGGLWAHEVWGRFWGWDAKETWALITWFVYLIYLFMRLAMGWRGRKAAYLSLIGFAVVLFTYGGVNYISDLHGFLSHGAE